MKFPLLLTLTVGLCVLVLMRLSLRFSAQWKLLKKDWTWKDELRDILFYLVLFVVLVLGAFKLATLLPM